MQLTCTLITLAQQKQTLQTADYAVLVGYFVLLIATGLWFSRKKAKNTEEYFLASRSMPVWAVALSILATAQSAATFTGVPQSSYAGDLTYLSSNIGGILGALILAWFFIPAYYRLGVATPYALLEKRFGRGARSAASWAYLGGRALASGARVFVGALPACQVMFGEVTTPAMMLTIVVFMVFGICYTYVGGVGSAIWTDVVQVCVYLGAAIVAIVILYSRIPVGLGEIVTALANPAQGPSKITLLSFSTDPNKEFTIFTVLTGFVLLTLASHGMDQDLVQRMLTCKDAKAGARSVISGVLVGIPAVSIFLLLGLLLYIFYQRPDIMGSMSSNTGLPSGRAFEFFAFSEMTGGWAGLFLAGLFAAGPAGINSGLNSMASTYVNDVYKPSRPDVNDAKCLLVGRIGVVASGVAIGVAAAGCQLIFDPKNDSLLGFVLGVMNFAYAGLLGMFLIALFTKRGSQASALLGLAGGFITVLLMQRMIWDMWTPHARVLGITWLPATTPAFPWHLVIGATVACGLCAIGKPRGPREVYQVSM